MHLEPQDLYGREVIHTLREDGPQTVREIAERYGYKILSVDQAVRRMMCRGYVKRFATGKGLGGRKATVYCWLEGDDNDIQPMMNMNERKRAIELADKSIQGLRAGFIPGPFDPFRVLRAQVGAT